MLTRRTFAIISHPDAGKTTISEKLLLFSGVISTAGTVKSRKSNTYATSDWMKIEQERGISITSSVMQFEYDNNIINLLDTPGHEDFSEDTYRTLTAVDSALMVIDIAKGVENRTVKLMNICRLRNTPIITFINKLDRQGQEPIKIIDEIEKVLNIECAPITWPIGMGSTFKGIVHLLENKVYLFKKGSNNTINSVDTIDLYDKYLVEKLGKELAEEVLAEVELIKEAMPVFDVELFNNAKQTPLFFGSAINNFGIQNLLDGFVKYASKPLSRQADNRIINPDEKKFSGFVFKIQANMNPKHHDRLAFMRIVSGKYIKGIKLTQVRTKKITKVNNAISFMSQQRNIQEESYAGDIIGIHNHGGIQIGDTFTEGEMINFKGVPNFAPELFKRVRLQNPLKAKALQKGLSQLSEEGATQVFRPLNNNEQILGAVGILQFDVVIHRLKYEYRVECIFEPINISTARWIIGDDKNITAIKEKFSNNLAIDISGALVYLAPSTINLNLTIERHPDLDFLEIRENL